MADDLINGYAQALLSVAGAEGGAAAGFESELSSVAQAIGASDQLGAALSDQTVPAARRQQIVEEILGGKASRVTMACVSMVIAAGRASDLARIADRVFELGSAQRGKAVAEVRSAIPLDEGQVARLATALKASTGKDVDVKVVIDPSVMGGLVTQIGDEVIDGSVRNRLGQLREAF